MFSAVASGIFAYRNVDKTRNGDIGRSAVALGQGAKLFEEISKYDNIAAKGAKNTISAFSKLSKEHKIFEYAGKTVKFAAENVNPLICASGVIKTAMAKDKLETGITEAAALSAMFAGEALIKKNYDKVIKSQTVRNGLKTVSNSKILNPVFKFLRKHKLNGKAAAIAKGLIFVAGSMTAYSIGHKIGQKASDKVKEKLGIEKINQKA